MVQKCMFCIIFKQRSTCVKQAVCNCVCDFAFIHQTNSHLVYLHFRCNISQLNKRCVSLSNTKSVKKSVF